MAHQNFITRNNKKQLNNHDAMPGEYNHELNAIINSFKSQ